MQSRMAEFAGVKSFADAKAEAFRQGVRDWLARSLPADWRADELHFSEDDQVELRRSWDRTLFEAGYAGLSWPVRFGGAGVGPVIETIFLEEVARAHAPEGLGRIGRVMAGPMIMASGTDAQRARFLPRMLDGSEIWCLGFSEPHAGSDLAAITTTATRDGERYLVRGRKIWTSYAHLADRCVLLARSSTDRPRHENISILLLNMRQPGVQVTPIITAAGDHHFNEVTFDGAVAIEDERLGQEHEGWAVFRNALQFERGGAVALNQYIEMCRECDLLQSCCVARSHGPGAAERAQSFNDRVELIRWHIMRMIELEENDRAARPAQLVLKLYWTELWQELTQFGAEISCARHRSFWRYQYLQARASTIYGGTSEIQRNTIARYALRSAQRAKV